MHGATTRYLEVRLEHVSLQRAGRAVLSDVSWRVRPGERWVLAGANGSGKTQLLKVLAGTVWPTPTAGARRRYRLRGKVSDTPYGIKDDIAYLGAERHDKYQRYAWNLPVAQIVGTGLQRSDLPPAALSAAERERVRRVLTRLALAGLAARPLLSLSYGERRAVLLARALVARPRLLLLDEVLNGLDAVNRRRLNRWLARRNGKLPWVLATHRLRDVPASATHALVLQRGRVVYAGALRQAPLARWLAEPAARRAPRARRPRARPGRTLLRLRRVRVYLEERRVLDGISFTVRAGEFWLVHGRNGSGKTTLLRTLYGDHAVAAGGAIERAGARHGMLEAFRKRVGLVAPHLQADYPRTLTVAEVVQSGRHASLGLNAPASPGDARAARRVLALFALTRLAARTLAELSYGQSRRVLFARALVCAPELLLLDEPLAGIDSPTRRALTARLLALAADGVTLVLSAHSPGEWRGCATHEIELSGGRASYCGPLRSRPQRRAATALAR